MSPGVLINAIAIKDIEIADDRRPINWETVKKLAASIREIGLQHAVTVSNGHDDGKLRLIAGLHRVEAMRYLGKDYIAANVVSMDKIDAEMWEISENLHRADLTMLQRSEQIARWIELQKQKRDALAVPIKMKGRKQGGINGAARGLGIEKGEAHRAGYIAALSPEAKVAAREYGLDNNKGALLAAAKEPPEQQVGKVIEIATEKARSNRLIGTSKKEVARLMSAWNAAGAEARQEFLSRLENSLASDLAGSFAPGLQARQEST
jgi:hypothetical protein